MCPRAGPSIVGVLAAIAAFAATCCTRPAQADGDVFVSMGTGTMDGVYYPMGRAVCRVVERDLREHRIRCSAEATPGSVYNLERLEDAELDFAIVQSDVQFDAYRGRGAWVGRPFAGLRSVLPLHAELVTIVARSDTGITSIEDLKGKRLNVGTTGSGSHATWNKVQASLGWIGKDSVNTAELKPDLTTHALCTGALDANLLLVGHPSAFVQQQLAACATNLVKIAGPVVERLTAEHPYFRASTIPSRLSGASTDVSTLGVRATLVTTASLDERIVKTVAMKVLQHVEELKMLHPALSGLEPDWMAKESLVAPLHPGAAAAFRELGLLR